MAGYELLDDRTRRHMLAAFDEAVRSGSVEAPGLMNDAGRERFPELVRAALSSGDEDTLFQSLADPSLWQLSSSGYDLISGFGMQASDWAGEARRVSSETFRRWYEAGITLRRQADGSPDAAKAAGGARPGESTGANRQEEVKMGLDDSERFRIEGLHYHPRHASFYVQLLGETLFFPRALSLTVREVPEERSVTITEGESSGQPLVALRRDGATVYATWL